MRRSLPSQVLVVLLFAAHSAFAQSKAKAENVPEIPYESVPDFLKLPPNLYLGESIGVAANSRGHVFGSTVHEIDCRNPNELFVSEITAWRVQKIILRPIDRSAR